MSLPFLFFGCVDGVRQDLTHNQKTEVVTEVPFEQFLIREMTALPVQYANADIRRNTVDAFYRTIFQKIHPNEDSSKFTSVEFIKVITQDILTRGYFLQIQFTDEPTSYQPYQINQGLYSIKSMDKVSLTEYAPPQLRNKIQKIEVPVYYLGTNTFPTNSLSNIMSYGTAFAGNVFIFESLNLANSPSQQAVISNEMGHQLFKHLFPTEEAYLNSVFRTFNYAEHTFQVIYFEEFFSDYIELLNVETLEEFKKSWNRMNAVHKEVNTYRFSAIIRKEIETFYFNKSGIHINQSSTSQQWEDFRQQALKGMHEKVQSFLQAFHL